MLIDKLDRCPFCLSKLRYEKSLMDCPNESSHMKQGRIWVWFHTPLSEERPLAINIRYKKYHLHLDLEKKITRMWDFEKEENWRPSCREYIIDMPQLIDFPLDLESIDKKVQTMLTFM